MATSNNIVNVVVRITYEALSLDADVLAVWFVAARCSIFDLVGQGEVEATSGGGAVEPTSVCV